MDYQSSALFSLDEQTTRLVAATADVFDVQSVRRSDESVSTSRGPWLRRSVSGVEIYGRLRVPSERAYDVIASRFRDLGHVALLRKAGDAQVVIAVPGDLPATPTRPWVALGFFLATLLSVLFVGAGIPFDQIFTSPLDMLLGWPFAVSLLSILLAHELGHYFVARRLGVPVSFPYFIPLPVSLLGTMGAVIQMKAPPRNRRHLLAVAVAGPLAGLCVAIPVLIIGLRLSQVLPVPAGVPIFEEGNSLLYAAIKILVFGRFLPSGGQDVFLHPVALAGWAGLLVTALNLIPAGQLDGGHVVNGLLGHRARLLTYGVIVALVALSILWQGWLLWAGLVFVFGRFRMEPLDDITALRTRERLLAILLIVVFLLVFTPVPMSM